MWDSAGLERYRALIPSYVRGASLIFIIYDVSSVETFNNLGTWINFIKQVNTDNSMIILCGNKTDLQRKVTTKEGRDLANKEQMMFFEVSAKTGENVNKMMYSCIAELPFFEQFQIDNKDQLIKELEGGNNKKEQNSIYDIVKEQKNEKQADLNVQGQKQNTNQNDENPGVIIIKKKKKKGCC
jgi:GTPase SAR1 family protein